MYHNRHATDISANTNTYNTEILIWLRLLAPCPCTDGDKLNLISYFWIIIFSICALTWKILTYISIPSHPTVCECPILHINLLFTIFIATGGDNETHSHAFLHTHTTPNTCCLPASQCLSVCQVQHLLCRCMFQHGQASHDAMWPHSNHFDSY